MKFRITVKSAPGDEQIHFGVGDPSKVADAFYDAGALGVTVMVLP